MILFSVEIDKGKLRRLKERNKKIQESLKKEKHVNKDEAMKKEREIREKLRKHLPPGTIDCILNEKVRTNWCHEDYQVALNMKLISPRALAYVRDPKTPLYLPLPHERSVNRKVEALDFYPGILPEVFKYLEMNVKHYDELDRVCILMFDEMKISEFYQYHRKSDSVFGGKKNVQVAMVKGLCGKQWKQVIYYDYDVSMTKVLLFHLISALEKTGYQVFAVVNDLGPSNQGLRKR